MAHGTLIGSAYYGINGGKCLVAGTEFAIKKGRTLIGGTGYDVPFSNDTKVEITGEGSKNKMYVIINGTKYYEPASLNFESTETVTILCYLETPFWLFNIKLVYNGVTVEENNSTISQEYDITGKNISVNLKYDNDPYVMTITEQ